MKPHITVDKLTEDTNRIKAHLEDRTEILDVPKDMGINVHDIIDFIERLFLVGGKR